jgi:tRNA uridine 5-carbamoylmethylation protein Kti12
MCVVFFSSTWSRGQGRSSDAQFYKQFGRYYGALQRLRRQTINQPRKQKKKKRDEMKMMNDLLFKDNL